MSEKQNSKQGQKIVDILEMFEKQNINEAPLYANSFACDRSLNLEFNNSLALMARHSIQNGLPIPKNMLSHSEDAFQSQERQYHQKQPDESHFKIQGAEDQLINTLNLEEFVQDPCDNTVVENTKNVLRNFGNAQNHYVLYHKRARQYLAENISDSKYFDEWVRSLKLQNFQNFKKAWSESIRDYVGISIHKMPSPMFYPAGLKKVKLGILTFVIFIDFYKVQRIHSNSRTLENHDLHKKTINADFSQMQQM